ncbi:MAG TPA: methyltransferase domain-containing protein [Gemmatimonadales bacterium]|nr:methyltransferase domain-containing protein [Gemmatimonadales bacterium]
MTEWFEQWFGEEYHVLYPHRDDAEARHAVALIRRVAPWFPGKLVLDLACGAGRHAAELERAGARVIGLDLSPAMLHRAQRRVRAPLVRGDMRTLPFRPGTFGLVVNLFTSFGYFRSDTEHGAVMQQVAEVLAPEGRFVIDYLNADQVRRTLRRDSEQIQQGDALARVKRRFSEEGLYVVKEIELRAENRSFQERVRLFTPAELEEMLTASGLEVVGRYGDYDGAPLGVDTPRTILVARRP